MLSKIDLEKIRSFAEEHDEIVALYVFGSLATGKDRRGSDFDLAIMVHGHMDGYARIRLETLLSNLLGRDVDLVVFGQSKSLLQHQILKYGQLLYEGDSSERIRQEVASRVDYMDCRNLFKEIGG